MNDVSDLSNTIKPKSDQLNADDLLTGPMTVTITDVTSGPADQPVHIHIEGQQPFKPCKTVRRVLITAWGQNGRDWVGKSMTLYCDKTVKFGGVALGGIRVSHLSHINSVMNMMLTSTRGKKAQCVINRLVIEDHTKIIDDYMNADQDQRKVMWATLKASQKAAIKAAAPKQ